MSDSGFSGIGAGRGPDQNSGSSARSGQSARLIAAPPDVQSDVRSSPRGEARPLRVEGEVVRSNDSGSVRIRTPRGDVDVQLPPETRPEQRPREGQRVEVEIRPNRDNPERAPEQVVIRPAPAPTPETRQATAQKSEAPEARNTQTPVDVNVRPSSDASAPERVPEAQPRPRVAPAKFPDAGSLVRLEPILPQQLGTIIVAQQTHSPPLITPSVLEPFTSIPETVSFRADLIVQDAKAALQTEATSILRPSTEAPAPIVPQILNAAPESIYTPAPAPQVVLDKPPLEAFLQRLAQAAIQIIAQAPAVLPAPVDISPDAPPAPTLVTEAKPIIIPPPSLQKPDAPAPQTSFFTPQSALPSLPQILSETFTQKPQQALRAIDARITGVQPPLVEITPPAPDFVRPQGFERLPPTAEPSAAPRPLILENQQAGQVTGTVIAQTKTDVPVLTLLFPESSFNAPSIQHFSLQFPSEAVALGTQIHVSPQAVLQASAQSISAPTGAGTSSTLQTLASIGVPASVLLAPQPWNTLQDIHQTLLQTAPVVAQAMAANTPSPAAAPAQFGAAAMFFIAALRGGDLSTWLGERASEAVKTAGRGTLLARLSGDGSILSALMSEPVNQDWRAMNIPLHWQGEFHKVSLYYKHDRGAEEQDSAKGQKAVRFVFDLSLDVMGNVQLDGLFRPVSESGARLDVILRTQQHFSQAMQAEMRRVYADAIKPSEMGGELSFQNADEGWVTIKANKDRAIGVEA